jgi:Protein of unknown function (DUF1553)/Protein of unknown function (DUF1549)/Planctomycete cytochrome C
MARAVRCREPEGSRPFAAICVNILNTLSINAVVREDWNMHCQFKNPLHAKSLFRFAVWLLMLSAYRATNTAALAEDKIAGQQSLTAAQIENFESNIRPVLVTRCYECHSSADPHGGFALDSREGLLKGGESGIAVVPGEPSMSRLVDAIRYKNRDLQMPPKSPLATEEVAAIEKWIADGAPDPRTEMVAENSPGPRGMSIAEGREFWSFQPIVDPMVPAVHQPAQLKSPIDAFVLASLEKEELSLSSPADKRTLLRRITFDLIGLPPTPKEVQDFLNDDSPQALNKVIDRLLASPHYGVRWGRHWLDVARYADSNGLDENLAYGNAWRYRDYVVDAFNSDKPFDRFLIEQLAGDLLPEANQEMKTATGFLALGAKVLAEPDKEKLVMDTIDEQLDALGKTFMGMTLGCVRCHDHKFDPLKQTDYYALAAILKSTQAFGDTKNGAIKHWYEHSFSSDEELTKQKEIDDAIAARKKEAAEFKNQANVKLRAQARALATEYLVAAIEVDSNASISQIESIAQEFNLHPRILQQCRKYIDEHSEHAFFDKWREFSTAGNVAGLEEHYRSLFVEMELQLAAAKKANPKTEKLDDPKLDEARAALYDNSGFLAIPIKPELAFDEETLQEYQRRMEEARLMESNAPDATTAMGVTDGAVLTSLPIHIRGSHRNFGAPVARNFPRVMQTEGESVTLSESQSGRLELAHWLANKRHPLTARVYVNRVWRWHFGAGLVNSTENFGSLGDRPSHPELLDWLATRFIESGWSTKALHRLILTSSTYQQGSQVNEAYSQIDPENRLLWKFNLQRLEAEAIRDSILFVSGRLDPTLGGKTVPLRNKQFVFDHTSIDHTRYDSLRRAVYLPVIRNNLYPMFEQFDFPDPTMPTGNRNATTIAPQALLLLNSELIMDSADDWARRLLRERGRDTARIALAYERGLSRQPTKIESQRGLDFISQMKSASASADRELQAWSLFCQSLFASNEFIYVR